MLKAIRNTMANYAGGLATLATMFVFNALYIRVVSAEAFGIISLLLTATVMLPALDLGIGRTARRHLAYSLVINEDAARLRDSVVTLMAANVAIALGLGMGLAVAAPAVATRWLAPQSLAPEVIETGVALIGANIPLMMGKSFVIACLNGMKHQVLANVLLTGFTFLRGIVGLGVLSTGNDPLQAFLLSQLFIHAADLLISGAILWMVLPAANRWPRLDSDVIRRYWRFSVSDGGAALIGACLAQGDKVLLSTLLPLSSYGAYALISTIAGGIGRLTSPFSVAFLPHFVELTTLRRKSELRCDYLVATQLLSCVILPIAAIMIAFAPEIVAAVLGSDDAPRQLPLVFGLLVVATVLNNLMYLPHGVQLAAGNSITALRFAAANAVIYIASILITTPRIGIIAPAISLLTIYAVTMLLFSRVSHRMLGLAGRDWFAHSILPQGFAAVAVAIVARVVTPDNLGLIGGTVWLALVLLAASAAAYMMSSEARKVVADFRARAKREAQ